MWREQNTTVLNTAVNPLKHISEKFGRAAGEYRKGHSFLIATDAIEITPGGIFVQEKVDGYEYDNHDYTGPYPMTTFVRSMRELLWMS
jgi:hypothetical protein